MEEQDWEGSKLGAYLLRDYWSIDGGLDILAGFDYSASLESAPYQPQWMHTLDPGALQGHEGKDADRVEDLLDRMRDDLVRLHIIWARCRREIEAEEYPPKFFIEWAISKTFIPDWLGWAIGTGRYSPKQEVDKATQAGAHADTPAAKVEALPVVSPSIKEIPGKMPNVKIGLLAIKAAWQIECETSKRATARQVIEMLQSWVDHKDNPKAVTELTGEIPNGVYWVTSAGKGKDYDIDACQKTLATWNKSRA